jgi:hypothetical protein
VLQEEEEYFEMVDLQIALKSQELDKSTLL